MSYTLHKNLDMYFQTHTHVQEEDIDEKEGKEGRGGVKKKEQVKKKESSGKILMFQNDLCFQY